MQAAKRINVGLWALQIVLGLFFVVASGTPKLILPVEKLAMPIELPHAFILFIGVAEIAGGLGLILPGLLRIRTGLTPLAAAGLVLVTIGATVYQLAAGKPGNAVFAVVIGALAASVAYGRWQRAPLTSPRRPRLLAAH